MRKVNLPVDYGDIMVLLRAEAKLLIEKTSMSHADALEHLDNIKRLHAKLVDAWGTGYGKD